MECRNLPSEFSPVHHRPASRRFPGLLWPSGAAHAAYRFRSRREARRLTVLCRKPGMPAEPRQPDDRPHAVGARVRSNGIPLSMDAVTFVDLLRDAGYRTALIGKSHLQNFTPHDPIIKRPPPRQGFHEPSTGLRRRCATISTTRNTSRRRRSIGREPARTCRRRSMASIM